MSFNDAMGEVLDAVIDGRPLEPALERAAHRWSQHQAVLRARFVERYGSEETVRQRLEAKKLNA